MILINQFPFFIFERMFWLRSTMDSIRASEAPDPSSILGEATLKFMYVLCLCDKKYYQRLLLQGAL